MNRKGYGRNWLQPYFRHNPGIFSGSTEEQHEKSHQHLNHRRHSSHSHDGIPPFTIIIPSALSRLYQRARCQQRLSLPTFTWRDGSTTGRECRDVRWTEKCQQLKGDVEGVSSWDLILWPQYNIHYKAHVTIQILAAQKRQSCFLTTLPHTRTAMPEGPKFYLHLGSPTRLNANLTMQGWWIPSNTTYY
jgi:hypothetical protein